MSTIKVTNIEHASTGNGGIQLDNTCHVTVDGQQMPTAGALSNRNILINGDCRIAQRATTGQSHSGVGSVYGVDRFYTYANVTGKVIVQQNAGDVEPPPGFQTYVGITSASSYTPTAGNVFAHGQPVEAQNAAELAWGTADAKPVTLSFWVRSSLTGTFGGSFLKQGFNRSYPYSYTINQANTWEYKTVTIAGDTDTSISYNMSGNGLFGYFIWDYGTSDNNRGTAGAWTSSHTEGATGSNRLVSTNNATWYITGIQLEVGEKATPFEHISYGDQLRKCMRYFQKLDYPVISCGMSASDQINKSNWFNYAVPLRATPSTLTFKDNTGTAGRVHWQQLGQGGSNVGVSANNSTRYGHNIRKNGNQTGTSQFIYAFEANAEL